MSFELILKIEFLRNLFMHIQKQVQNMVEFIDAVKHSSASPCFSIISMFLLDVFPKYETDQK